MAFWYIEKLSTVNPKLSLIPVPSIANTFTPDTAVT